MDWPSTNRARGERRVCRRGAHHGGFGRYSEARRHATLSPLCAPRLPHTPFSSPFLPLLYAHSRSPSLSLSSNLPTARTHTFRGQCASLFTRPTTEKQDGDLWDGAGRRHPFNGLPKRLNFVADPATRAGFRSGLHAFEMLSPGGLLLS